MARAIPITGLDVEAPVLSNVLIIVRTRLGEMLEFEPFIHDEDRIYELHQMRIAAKRLRYTLEIFLPLLTRYTENGKSFAEATSQVKLLQEHLGELHDADVLVPRLEDQMARMLKPAQEKDGNGEPRAGVSLVDLDGCQGLLKTCVQVRRERMARYKLFLKDWTECRKSQLFEKTLTLLEEATHAAMTIDRTEAAV